MEEGYRLISESASGGELCVVVYRSQELETSPPKDEPVLLIAHWRKPVQLALFLNTIWREFVREEDREYIESLIEDLPQRAQIDSEGLFRHLSSLHAGPLITAEERSMASKEDFRSYIPAKFTKLS